MIRESADALERLRRRSSSADGNLVDGFAAIEEFDQHGKDRFVDVRVKIRRPHDFADRRQHFASTRTEPRTAISASKLLGGIRSMEE